MERQARSWARVRRRLARRRYGSRHLSLPLVGLMRPFWVALLRSSVREAFEPRLSSRRRVLRRSGLRVGLNPWSESVSDNELLHSAAVAAVATAAVVVAGALEAVSVGHNGSTGAQLASSPAQFTLDDAAGTISAVLPSQVGHLPLIGMGAMCSTAEGGTACSTVVCSAAIMFGSGSGWQMTRSGASAGEQCDGRGSNGWKKSPGDLTRLPR